MKLLAYIGFVTIYLMVLFHVFGRMRGEPQVTFRPDKNHPPTLEIRP